jgi:hypothetical protein
VITAQQSAEVLPAYDRSGPVEGGWRYAARGAEVALAEKYELAETLTPDRTHEALGPDARR